jgi:hypothetical protein
MGSIISGLEKGIPGGKAAITTCLCHLCLTSLTISWPEQNRVDTRQLWSEAHVQLLSSVRSEYAYP